MISDARLESYRKSVLCGEYNVEEFDEIIERLRSAESVVKKAANSELNSKSFGFIKEARAHFDKVKGGEGE